MTHLSLFTGIGGLDLAAEWAGFTTVGQCEYAEYPRKVLERHWPDVERWRDIHDLRADEFIRRTGIGAGELTCISGGFPCQPHSVAGMRKASSDGRDLWPEYRRVIGELKPKWAVAENVRGLLSSESGRFFRGILRDFADMGYDAGWCCYRAADVGAVHPRERIGIIAHATSERLRSGGGSWKGRYLPGNKKWDVEEGEQKRKEWEHRAYEDAAANADIDSKRMEGGGQKPILGEQALPQYIPYRCIEEWARQSNLFEPKLLRNYHGIPGAVDRIKCLGNAVVPQQFYPIFKAIADMETGG